MKLLNRKSNLMGAVSLGLTLIACQSPNTTNTTQTSEQAQINEANPMIRALADYQSSEEMYYGSFQISQQPSGFTTALVGNTLETLSDLYIDNETEGKIYVSTASGLIGDLKADIDVKLDARKEATLDKISMADDEIEFQNQVYTNTINNIGLNTLNVKGSKAFMLKDSAGRESEFQALTFTDYSSGGAYNIYVSENMKSESAGNMTIDMYLKAEGQMGQKESFRYIDFEDKGAMRMVLTRNSRNWSDGYEAKIYEERTRENLLQGQGSLTLTDNNGEANTYILTSRTDSFQKTRFELNKVSETDNYTLTFQETSDGQADIWINDGKNLVKTTIDVNTYAKVN